MRTNYICVDGKAMRDGPDCGQNAWAKPDALLGCYACYEETEELVLMLAEPSDEDEAP
jgi:hypothetical protein